MLHHPWPPTPRLRTWSVVTDHPVFPRALEKSLCSPATSRHVPTFTHRERSVFARETNKLPHFNLNTVPSLTRWYIEPFSIAVPGSVLPSASLMFASPQLFTLSDAGPDVETFASMSIQVPGAYPMLAGLLHHAAGVGVEHTKPLVELESLHQWSTL